MPPSLIAHDTKQLSTTRFYKSLDRLMGASIGVIAVRTRELERAKLNLHQWASMRNMDYRVWDNLSGFNEFRRIPITEVEGDERPEISVEEGDADKYLTPVKKIDNTEQITDALAQYRMRQENKSNKSTNFCGVFVGIDGDYFKDPMVQQHIRDHVHRAYQCGDRIILLLTPGTQIPETMVGDIEVIDLPLPSAAELLDILIEMEDSIPDELKYKPSEQDRELIVQNAIGMTAQEFENAISFGIVDLSDRVKYDADNVIGVHDFIAVMRERKLEILKNTQILELMPEAKISDVGGLDNLKAALELQRHGFDPKARAFGIRPAKGFIVVGPPGTGKSLVCKAVSYILGIPAIRFDMSSVYNSLLGSSEARMRSCLKMVEDMAPCILFVDEIEKALGSSGGNDGGVSQRIFGLFLTWLQDRQDKEIPVIVVASANNVQGIPPELLRKGRFDAIWGLGFPSPSERELIFNIHIKKRGHTLDSKAVRRLAAETNTFVGSEIEAIVEEALTFDFVDGNETITEANLRKSLVAMVPQARAFPERIEAMRAWCVQNAKPASTTGTLDITDAPVITTSDGGEMVRVKRVLKLPKRASSN